MTRLTSDFQNGGDGQKILPPGQTKVPTVAAARSSGPQMSVHTTRGQEMSIHTPRVQGMSIHTSRGQGKDGRTALDDGAAIKVYSVPRKIWVSPKIARSKTASEKQNNSSNPRHFSTGPGSYEVGLRNSIGANSRSGFTFPKASYERTSTDKRVLLHGGCAYVTYVSPTPIHAYTSTRVHGLGSDVENPLSCVFARTSRPVFGFEPRFMDPVPSSGLYILDMHTRGSG